MIIETDDVICAQEIAEMAHVVPSAVSNWRRRLLNFPSPVVTLRLGDLWLRSDVETWLADRDVSAALRRQRNIEYHERALRILRGQ